VAATSGARSRPANTVGAALSYFALVFGAGFALGMVRVPLLVPRLGERVAELLEMPIMLVVIVAAARFVTRRFAVPAVAGPRLVMGLLALALLVTTELSFALLLGNSSLGAYLASRDPVSGSVYLALLGVMAAMPLWLGRKFS
jgi:hypothetical protein